MRGQSSPPCPVEAERSTLRVVMTGSAARGFAARAELGGFGRTTPVSVLLFAARPRGSYLSAPERLSQVAKGAESTLTLQRRVCGCRPVLRTAAQGELTILGQLSTRPTQTCCANQP